MSRKRPTAEDRERRERATRREAEAEMRQWVDQLVDLALPLDQRQRARLAALLRRTRNTGLNRQQDLRHSTKILASVIQVAVLDAAIEPNERLRSGEGTRSAGHSERARRR